MDTPELPPNQVAADTSAHTPPFVNDSGALLEGSIAEIETIELGGVTQTVILRGASLANPVLLFLHGGPGTSEFSLVRQRCPELEELFTVAHWEQRGSGLSYHEDIDPETMTLAQIVEDAAELTRSLCERFEKPKIYVMGHSWGTLVGANLVHKYPELFEAYIGFGHVASTLRSEQVGYDWLIAQLTEAGDHENLERFSALPRPDETIETFEEWNTYLREHRPLCQKYGGGNSHYEEWDTEKIITMYDETPEYGVKGSERVMLPGLMFSIEHLLSAFVFQDLFKSLTEFKLPMYIMNGVHDYQTAHQVAYEYYEAISAPKKRFISFERSAHTPFYDEPERFMQVVREIIAERRGAL